jgi:hypothetical protein
MVSLRSDLRSVVVGDLARQGFSVQHVGVDGADPTAPIRSFIEAMGLGEPYIPVLYRRTADGVFSAPIVQVSASSVVGSSHPAFTTAAGTALHTDGTLERLGDVRTTLLHCHRPSVEGGESHVFDLAAAVDQLLVEDSAAAMTLFDKGVLRRWSTLEGTALSCTDAVAGRRACGRLTVRYSEQDRDEWLAPPGKERALQRARSWLVERAQPGSPLFTSFSLGPGDLLVLANDRVAHGRGSYRDDPSAPRCLFRALFLESLCLE